MQVARRCGPLYFWGPRVQFKINKNGPYFDIYFDNGSRSEIVGTSEQIQLADAVVQDEPFMAQGRVLAIWGLELRDTLLAQRAVPFLGVYRAFRGIPGERQALWDGGYLATRSGAILSGRLRMIHLTGQGAAYAR